METEDDYVEVPSHLLQKIAYLHPRLIALIIDSSLVNFCKTIFVTLAFFFLFVLFWSTLAGYLRINRWINWNGVALEDAFRRALIWKSF